jgi:quercetin dioxygenase-like cupin family protein
VSFVEDPLFRQRYRFSREGDILRVEMWTEPGGGVSIEHFHPRQEERFEVLEGEITFRVNGEKRRVGSGEWLVAEPGVRHTFENTGRGVAHHVSEAQPALELQGFIEEAAALARAGKYTRRGTPKGLGALLEASEMAERYRETVVLTVPPPTIQRILLPPLARLQRRRGSRAGRKQETPL